MMPATHPAAARGGRLSLDARPIPFATMFFSFVLAVASGCGGETTPPPGGGGQGGTGGSVAGAGGQAGSPTAGTGGSAGAPGTGGQTGTGGGGAGTGGSAGGAPGSGRDGGGARDSGRGGDTGAPPAAGPAIDVLTFKYNNARTGWNAAEKQLTPANVVPATFGKIFTRMVDGQIYAQPLIVSGLSIGGQTRNVVYVVTMKNSIYAFDADDRTATMPLWRANLGPTVPKADVCGCNDIQPEIGATATPVIDKAAGTIYFTTKHLMGGNYINRLHALDIVTGMPRQGSPVTITGSVPGTGQGSAGGTLNFDGRRHLNRVALLLQGGNVYIAFGSHGDTPPYHGWVFGYNASTLMRVGNPFCTTPNAGFGGIWQSGNGLVGDGQNIYFATGNGSPSNPNSNPPGLGEAFVKLNNNLALVDWQMRGNFAQLDQADVDFGSAGPMLIPNTNFLVMSGKDGDALVYNRNQLGRFVNGQDVVAQKFRGAGWPNSNAHFSGWILWEQREGGPVAYAWPSQGFMYGFRWTGTAFNNTAPVYTGTLRNNPIFTPFWPVGSSDGAQNGIIFAYSTAGMNPNQQLVPGVLRAFNATTAAQIWSSNTMAGRDGSGTYATFTQPVVANGKVYVNSWSGSVPGADGVSAGQLLVYGLLNN